MSEFLTRAEITAALEFIQYEEELRSGSLVSGLGTNRSLERLAENADALRQGLQQMLSASRLAGGGTVTFSAGTLTWSATLSLRFFDQAGTVENSVSASSVGSIVSGDVIYAIVDRTSTATVALVKAASAAFLTTLAGATARMDYVPLCYYDGSVLHFANGKGLTDGESFTNGFATESQYGQQSELTLVRTNQKQNLNLRLTGGGDISWDAGTNTLSWTQDLRIEYPMSAGENTIAGPAAQVMADDSVWYATLSRAPAGSGTVSTGTGSLASGLPDSDDSFVLALHRSAEDRVYLADGTALSDGETVQLGGVRIGVQYYIHQAGSATQVLDLTATAGANASYRRGSGELMVYRNGIKAIASPAYWEGGSYPTGSLNTSGGTVRLNDDYVEEDLGDGTGNRIIWLADGQAVAEPLYHTSGDHDPALEWPSSDDVVEVFVGVQGQAPTITIPDGIYGFGNVWAQSPTEVRAIGGTLVAGGAKFISSSPAPLALTPSDMFGSDTLAPDAWHYIYLGPGANPGADPSIVLSTTAPQVAAPGKAGTHPDNELYRFLSSVYVDSGSEFLPFVKAGNRVTLGGAQSLLSLFVPGLVTSSYENVDLSTLLPDSGVHAVELRLEATSLVGVTAGDRVLMQLRTDGFTGARSYRSVKPGNSNDVEFLVEVVLSSSQVFELNLDATDFNSFAAADLLAYTEGTNSAGNDLGA